MAKLSDLFDTNYVVYQTLVQQNKIPGKSEEESETVDEESAIDRLRKELGTAKRRISALEASADEETEEAGETEEVPESDNNDQKTEDDTFRQEMEELFRQEGIHAVVTSGKEKRDNDKSYHNTGRAIDIKPADGYTFGDLKAELKNSTVFRDYMKNNNLGIIDETKEETKKLTHATGNHYHIGPDQMALDGWQEWLNESTLSRYGGKFNNIRKLYGQSFDKRG